MSSQDRESGMPQSPEAVRRLVLEHLERHRSQLSDRGNSLKAAGVTLAGGRGVPQGAVLLELFKDGAEESADESEKREKLTSMIQGLVENVQEDGERVVVVNVNTPAVDLRKDFAPEEIEFMRDDIFASIRRQVGEPAGAGLGADVEGRWATAFDAIMDVVRREKGRE